MQLISKTWFNSSVFSNSSFESTECQNKICSAIINIGHIIWLRCKPFYSMAQRSYLWKYSYCFQWFWSSFHWSGSQLSVLASKPVISFSKNTISYIDNSRNIHQKNRLPYEMKTVSFEYKVSTRDTLGLPHVSSPPKWRSPIGLHTLLIMESIERIFLKIPNTVNSSFTVWRM